jgi:hypothetical protein
MKPPYVYINGSYHLKNAPEQYRGILTERWSIGKTKPATLDMLLIVFAKHLIDFYINARPDVSSDVINDQIEAAAKIIGIITVGSLEQKAQAAQAVHPELEEENG